MDGEGTGAGIGSVKGLSPAIMVKKEDQLMRRDQVLYWATATVFSILFGEIISPMLAHHPLPILQYPVAFLIYYAILSAVFAIIVQRSVQASLIVFFVYGVVAELLLFNNIRGITDIPGILFFGLFYVFLFGTPIWIARKLSAR
jgi:hypothetical protein